MSRTIRRLPIGRRYTVKDYRHRYSVLDYNVLRHRPPVCIEPARKWVMQEVTHYPTERKFFESYEAFERHGGYSRFAFYDTTFSFGSEGLFATRTLPSYTSIVPVKVYHHRSEAHWAYDRWLRVHHEVHRNGSCRRQRINGVRKSKEIDRRQRRSRDKAFARREIHEYFVDQMEDYDMVE